MSERRRRLLFGHTAGTPLHDTFTDADGTGLAAHTMDAGPGWTVHAGTGTLQSGKLQSGTSGTALRASSASGYADCAASVAVTLPASGPVCAGLLLRLTDANTGWAAVFSDDGGGLTASLVRLGGLI